MLENTKVIIIDNDQTTQKHLSALLQKHNYATQVVSSANAGWRTLRKIGFDLILLELDLPDMDGLAFLRAITEFTSCPIVILSRRDDEESLVSAFEAGAADVMTKPFSERELLARIKVRLRPRSSSKIKIGALEIDFEHQLVKRNGEEHAVRLSNTEWRLLKLLVKEAPQIVSYHKLLNYVWGPQCSNEIHYLHVYIGRLRRKLEKNAREPRFIVNEQGVGYRFYC